MGIRLLILFVVVPLVELTLLVRIGESIGLLNTILIIVLTGLAGTALARHQGMEVWRRFNARISQGQVPGSEIIDGLIILVCGALLMTPGVLTDFIGLLGLIPLSRGLIRKQLSAYAKRHTVTSASTFTGVRFGNAPFGDMSGGQNGSAARSRGEKGRDISRDVESYKKGRNSA